MDYAETFMPIVNKEPKVLISAWEEGGIWDGVKVPDEF